MSISADADRLRTIPLFADLPADALARLADAAAVAEFEAGQTLVERHDVGSGMYVIEEGTVSVELHGRDVELGPGEFVGELSLLVPEARRAARVRALTPVRCLAIRRDDFTSILESEPAVALTMLRTLARRLLDLVEAT